MDVPQRSRPAWATHYLQFSSWTYDEFRNLVCGLPPKRPDDEPPQHRAEQIEHFVRCETLRQAADRHIRDAVVSGELNMQDPLDEGIVHRLTGVLTPVESDRVRRALVHERICDKSYVVARDVAIRWASRHQSFFPDFPFDDSDVPGGGVALDAPASDELKEHRRRMVARKVDELGFMTKGAFCKSVGISDDGLRGIVNGDRKRYSEETERKVLEALGVTRAEWNRVP